MAVNTPLFVTVAASRVPGPVSRARVGFGACFDPLVVSLFWQRMNRRRALAGMVVGAATVILWKQYADSGLYGMVPGVLAATAVTVLVNLLTAAPTARMQTMHQQVRQILREQGH